MKKIILSGLGCILILITIHLSTPSYGGILGVWHRAQGKIVTYYATIVRDPGACGLIRGYWGRSIHEKLRDKCVAHYIQNIVQQKEDCHIDKLISDMSGLSSFWLRDEYRYTCLIRHYQAMLGNSLTQQWLPERCLNVRDKLVAMQHYIQDIRVARVAKDNAKTVFSPLSNKDISTIEQCENFLDTPRIYAFLRDDAYTEEEEQYIEGEKRRIFELK